MRPRHKAAENRIRHVREPVHFDRFNEAAA